MRCDEKLPAVCYNYRQTSKHNCEQVDGKVWTLFQGKCFYVYSSPTSNRSIGYKTFFDAQKECKKMGAIVATVADEATFKRTLDLATGAEKILGIDDGTWIGLQLSGMGYGGIYYNITDGTTRNFEEQRTKVKNQVDEPWPPEKIEGWWEDGTRYDGKELKRFWAHMVERLRDIWGLPYTYEWDQPNEEELADKHNNDQPCSFFPDNVPEGYNRDRCDIDKLQHCTQIFPGSTEAVTDCSMCKAYGYKWNDRWCYFLQRGYICQRDADSVKDPYRLNDEL
ncbi:hypothetical protein AAVH_40492 [Aphelenchoides avenae]|nr:hypothetical protein AAVH_40492 [Aphelenchus avenae]